MKIQKTLTGEKKVAQYTVTLPRLMVENKGWDKGTELFFVYNERGNIELTTSCTKRDKK